MNLDFSDRTVVVTGAASGIGLATSRAFLAAGARVWLSDIDERALSEVAASISEPHARFRPCDVTNTEQVDHLVDMVLNEDEQLDVLVNNVGVTHFAPLANTSTTAWTRTIEITLNSAFYGARAALRPMLAQRRGAIVNISSGAGLLSVPNQSSYGAAKAGVISMTRTAAIENGTSGVRINCVVPGPIDTPPVRAWMASMPDGGSNFQASQPSGRLGNPEEIANAVVFLASDQASYINGTTLVVDGGVSAALAYCS